MPEDVEKTPMYLDAPSSPPPPPSSANASHQLSSHTSTSRSDDDSTETTTTAAHEHTHEHKHKHTSEQPSKPQPRSNLFTKEAPDTPTSTSTGTNARAAATAAARTPTSGLERTVSRIRSRDPSVGRIFGHPLSHIKTNQDCLVEFEGPDDPYNAHNWPEHKKWISVVLYGLTTATVTFDSSVYSAAVMPISQEFGVDREVATLGLTFMLFGFGIGPLAWAPLSELYGRKRAVLLPFALSMIFTFATAASKDIQSVLITRFFAGLTGGAPIVNTGGVLGDIFTAEKRGIALVIYAFAVTGGPILGPIVGGALVSYTSLGWRWTEIVTGILKIIVLIADIIVLDESYGNVLLQYKAQRLRIETGNWALHAKHEEWDVSIRDIFHKYLIRPFRLLATPICFFVAMYASFVYGILYSLLEAIPIVFQEQRGWGPVTGALPFLAVLVGIILAGGLNLLNQKYYFRAFVKNGNKAVPEARLPPMMIGGVLMCAAMFMYAWVSDPSIFWFPDLVALALFGFGFFAIFQAALNYLVDTFTTWGASAIAANTFLRSVFAGAFPLFIRPMLENLGVGLGVSIFGIVSFVLIPVPFVFYIFGKRIRARGEWSRGSL